jgi:hypothetical protein
MFRSSVAAFYYKAPFEKPDKELVQQCVRPGDSDGGKFKALTNVGAKGWPAAEGAASLATVK